MTDRIVTGKTASWVIVERSTGKAVMETFSARVAGAVNAEKYEAVPILEYLHGFNERVRAEAARGDAGRGR